MTSDMNSALACKQWKRTEKLNNRWASESDKKQRVFSEDGRKNTKRVRKEDYENTDADAHTDK